MTYMKSIYKACVLSGPGAIDRFVVFAGMLARDADLTLLDPHTKQPVFSEAELVSIAKDDTRVVFSTQQVHPDDSISAIKHKIASELERPLNVEEIYLFCLRSETHAPDGLYRALTQNKRTQLTRARMRNALNNFKSQGLDPHVGTALDDNKETYLYDDVLKLGIFNKDQEVSTAHMLGQRMFLMNNYFPTSFNPFDDLAFDNLLVTATMNALTTTNSGLLLDSGEIIDGTIYVCLATDVLDNVVRTSPNVTDKYLMSIYFPLLIAQNMHSKADIESAPGRIALSSKGGVFDAFAKEDLLHRVHGEMDAAPFTWESRGVSEIKIAIHQRFTLKVPLDVIFKLVPTSPTTPLTKLNPGGHRENMFRIYGETMSTDGRKIPQLSKQMTQHLMLNMGTTKGVSIYFALDKGVFLTCDFEENGDIIVYGKFTTSMPIDEVADLIALHVNPLIKTVEPFFTQSGYRHNVFGSLHDKHIEVVHMEYTCIATVDVDVGELSVQPIHGCISPMFVVESTEVGSTTGARMRYRKVSNFDKMTSKEAFVIDQLKRHDGFQGAALIQSIMTNYGMSDTDARELVARVGAELTMDNGTGVHTTKIRTNPGFMTVISDATTKGLRSSGRVSVSVSGIDNILYIAMIDDYVGALLRLLLDRAATDAQFPALAAVCAATADDDGAAPSARIDDVHGAPDRGMTEQQDLTIEDGEVVEAADAVEAVEADDVVPASNALSLLYADSLMYADEDEEDYNSEDDETHGGAGDRSIVGMRLKKPSPFMAAMEAAEPELFLKVKVGNYERYSRTCDAAFGRQPVLLTQVEHAQMVADERAGIIDRYGSDDFYDLHTDDQADVIRQETETDDRYTVSYGTSAENQYVYICPRYWCLKTNTFIHPKEMETVMEDGKEVLRHPTCGGVMPRGRDKVQDDGKYVYEFTGDGRKGKTGDYALMHPGFQDDNKHPKGFCVPCCFKFNVKDGEVLLSDKQSTRRRQCVVEPPNSDEPEPEEKEKEKEQEQTVRRRRAEGHYIMDQNTSPIPLGRWAYLNIEVQHFFKEYATAYQVPSAPTQLRPQVLALLRHGVESSATQPFLACMADVMFFGAGAEAKTLPEFKEYLADGLTLEAFAGLQNGNLAATFSDTAQAADTLPTEVDVEEHATSPLRQLKNAGTNGTEHEQYFTRLVLAFRRYRAYLRSPTAVIDHTYTWDLVCAPGVHASHPKGINLIILEIPEADTTTNVSIVCPSNHYSAQQFSSSRPSVIVVKKGGAYEPVYSYAGKEKGKDTVHTAYFHPDAGAPPSVIAAINTIVKPLHNKRCGPLRSMKQTYVFQQPILLGALLHILGEERDTPVKILKQVLNFSHKVIGLEVSIGDVVGYVPCYPSGYMGSQSNLVSGSTGLRRASPGDHTPPVAFMDDVALYHSYVDTIFFADLVAHTFGQDTIPIHPAYKVVDEEMIIGVLTIADQFIMFSEPIELSSANDDIPVLHQTGRLGAEAALRSARLGAGARDAERIDHVNKIKLETNFFLAYRNTLRILLNDYANLALRAEIEERLADVFVPHSKKLESVTALLRRLIGSAVRFDADMDTTMIQHVLVCINNLPQQCVAANPVCVTDGADDGSDDSAACALVIPKVNLVSPNVDNEFVYINKMADQLIRYDRIRKYMMDPTQFLSFGQAHYDLGEHEFVVAHTVLKNEYFANLVAQKPGANRTSTYDETDPDARHRMEHIDAFSAADVATLSQIHPVKLKIRGKLRSDA